VEVHFSGGLQTDPVDRGRPVNLIAGALGVSPQVFREAFSRVRPAPNGAAPSAQRARENKAVLMQALAPYGITNERLDDVSNHYRIRPQKGEVWPHTPAQAQALVRNGKVVGFEITRGGAGYNMPPGITLHGMPGVKARAILSSSPHFEQNGAVSAIELVPAATPLKISQQR
jgi:hypothetical protein